MNILEILQNDGEDLLPEDLELFRTELAVGDYSSDYRKTCIEIIKQFEKENVPSCKNENKESKEKELASVMRVNSVDLIPEKQKSVTSLPFPEQFKADVKTMRLSAAYKKEFRKYVKSHEQINEDFTDAVFTFFESWELEVIVSEVKLSEEFLEKYFSVLNKDKIARYQIFSEHFYQKHFSDFNSETVFLKGKNEWRKKENRTKQFDIFLRLKGVQY